MKVSSSSLVDLVLSDSHSSIEQICEICDRSPQSAPATESTVDSPTALKPQHQSVKASNKGIWGIFASTFLTIFLAEMGDKTQLATLLMSAESHSPWVVFAGAASALVATSLLGVLIGRWIATRLSPKTIETAAGVLLLFISVSLLWDVVHF